MRATLSITSPYHTIPKYARQCRVLPSTPLVVSGSSYLLRGQLLSHSSSPDPTEVVVALPLPPIFPRYLQRNIHREGLLYMGYTSALRVVIFPKPMVWRSCEEGRTAKHQYRVGRQTCLAAESRIAASGSSTGSLMNGMSGTALRRPREVDERCDCRLI
jgi:hypothetical protein